MNQKEYDPEWEMFKKEHYGTKVVFQSEWGTIDFDPEKKNEVVGGDKLTYDEYLDVLKASGHKCRSCFETCYYECALGFKGEIEKKTKDKICFKRIYVSGMYRDGSCFDGTEDHVWMEMSGFENYQVADNLSFFADIYRYLKTGKGKMIDFGLRNPSGAQQVDDYILPSNLELRKQAIEHIICETCYLSDYCNKVICMVNRK